MNPRKLPYAPLSEPMEHAPIACPSCGHNLDMASGVGHENAPDKGGAGICIRCGQWHMFTKVDGKLGMRQPTTDELIELHTYPEVRQLEAAWAALQVEIKAGRVRVS